MTFRATATILISLALPATGLAQNFGIKEISRWDGDGGGYADVCVDGDIAYLGHYTKPQVYIIDISDRAAPNLLSTFHIPPPNKDAQTRDLTEHDGLLYVALQGDR